MVTVLYSKFRPENIFCHSLFREKDANTFLKAYKASGLEGPEKNHGSTPENEGINEIKENTLNSGVGLHSDPEGAAETSQETLHSKFLGTLEISIVELVEPEGKHRALRVRQISDSRVEDLISVLKQQRSPTLSSELTVLKTTEDEYVLLDGNHRYKAMMKLRALPGTADWFQSIRCRIYTSLTTQKLCTWFTTGAV